MRLTKRGAQPKGGGGGVGNSNGAPARQAGCGALGDAVSGSASGFAAMDAERDAGRANLADVGRLRGSPRCRLWTLGCPPCVRDTGGTSAGRPHDQRSIGLGARQHAGNGRQFVTRRFTPSMALRTAIQASHEWHEAVASHMDDAGDLALPPPWYPPATQGGFDIVPLTTSADLYREGHAMHHCVATYVDQVRQGNCYIFSVRRDGKRIATVSLICHGETVSIQQLRGPCNTAPPKAVAAAVRQWLRAQRTTAATIRQQYEEWSRDADQAPSAIGSCRP